MTLQWAAMACRAIALATVVLMIAIGWKPVTSFIARHEITITVNLAPRAPLTDARI
jgi:hypothetical protein